MAEGLGFDRERPDARLVPAFVVVALALLTACDGDTLYDRASPDLVPPSVAILAPEAGDEVLAGQAVPVRVVAADEDGVTSLEIRVSGSFAAAISRAYDPPLLSVEVDTTITVPAEAEGSAVVSATAINTRGGVAEAEPVQFNVALVDSIAPTVSIQVRGLLNEGLDTVSVRTADRLRLELRDSLLVDVTALDNPGGSGIRVVGVSAVVTSSTRTDTLAIGFSRDLGVARADTVQEAFTIAPPFADSLNLPDSMDIEIYGWTVDDGGSCSADIVDSTDRLRCLEATYGTETVTVATLAPTPQPVIAVVGRGKKLQEQGTIADLLVDTARSRAYLSNLSNNKVQVFLPSSFTWGADVLVAAEPWGLALNIDQDTLFVGNSGGTSISFVSVNGTPREDLNRRLVTRNTPLFEVRKDSALTEAGRRRYDGKFIDFSDRPQFMAQDFTGRLLYSTKPTTAQRNGTLRVVVDEPGWSEPEARILIRPEDVLTQDTASISIANIDSLFVIQSAGAHDLVELFDHEAGFPDRLIRSGPLQLEQAVGVLAQAGSDIFWRYGNWDLFAVGFADTTYVGASGDRRWVAFGEGGRSGASRIVLWDATASRIHSRLLVADLVNNASERVRGVDLNEDGSLGASRGAVASYFFRLDLRLQGSVSEVTEGGSGTVLHWDHPDYVQGLTSSERTIAFLGTGDNKVKILDTVHFTERGTIEIRDALAGPLRAAPPLRSDNGGAGRNCSASTCVVAKLYGMTTRGSLVVIDVRRQDILPLP